MNLERIRQDLSSLAKFGQDPRGGTTRLPLTDAQTQADSYLIKKMKEAGLTVTVDGIGNIFGRREGERADLPSIIMGSHLDTVINGGNFDGILGVVAGLEVVRALNEADILTEYPIEVCAFFMEESSSFGKSCIGSRALIGKLSYEELGDLKNKDKISLQEALKEKGIGKKEILSVQRAPETIKYYLELHIEQADTLIKEDKPVGIVTAIAAATRLKVEITGEAAHSGATIMSDRKDALCAAAEIVLGVEEIAKNKTGDHTVGTVGSLDVSPGSVNIVPGLVELQIDLRDIEKESKDKAFELIKKMFDDIEKKRSVSIKYQVTADDDPAPTNENIQQVLEKAALDLDIDAKLMPSKAAHDAYYVSEISDMGMIFVRSYGGSHNPKEKAEDNDIALAVELLLETVIRLANHSEQ